MDEDAVTLFRSVGPQQLDLIRRTQFCAFPPRLPDQPIFYPVLSEEYAAKIASDWNAQGSRCRVRYALQS